MKNNFLYFYLIPLSLLIGCASSDGVKEYNVGQTAYAVRDFAKADKYFTKSMEIKPTANASLMLARVKLETGDLSGAEKAIWQAERLSNGEYDVLQTKGQLLYHLKKYEESKEIFAKIAGNAKLPNIERSKAFSSLGIVLMTCNLIDEARVAFMLALRFDRRGNPSAYYHLGLLYRDSFDFQEAAQEQFEIFVRLPDSPLPRKEKVQRDFLPAICDSIARSFAQIPNTSKRNSQTSAQLLLRGEAELAKKNTSAALKSFKAALASDPLSFPAQIAVANLLAANKSLGSAEEMFYAYLNACKLRPTSTSTLLKTARLAYTQGRYMSAVKLYSRALAFNPSKRESIEGLISSLIKTGDKKKAAIYSQYKQSL